MQTVECPPKKRHENKSHSQKIARSDGLAPDFKRSEAIFQVNAFVIVEVNILSNELFKLAAGSEASPVQALRLERPEEIFHDGVVIGASGSGHRRSEVIFWLRSKYALEVYCDPWSLWRASPSVTFSFFNASRTVSMTREEVMLLPVRHERTALPHRSSTVQR